MLNNSPQNSRVQVEWFRFPAATGEWGREILQSVRPISIFRWYWECTILLVCVRDGKIVRKVDKMSPTGKAQKLERLSPVLGNSGRQTACRMHGTRS